MAVPTRAYLSQAEITRRIEYLDQLAIRLQRTREAHWAAMEDLAQLYTYVADQQTRRDRVTFTLARRTIPPQIAVARTLVERVKRKGH